MKARIINKRNASTTRGFALITAIALMGFIVLLLSALVTLVQIELASMSISKSQAEAEQNALLGLQTALGQLQELNGHDQRVTVRADLFDDAKTIVQPYWTGVVSTNQPPAAWNTTMTMDEKFDAVKWLVSGNETLEPSDSDYHQPGESIANPALLVSAPDTGPGPLVSVTAPQQPVLKDGTTTGYYAYWIGDEGIKARFNLVNPYADSGATDVEKIRAFQTAQRTGIEAIDAMSSYPVNGANLPLLTSVSDARLLVDDTVKDRFHDITFWSNGVLSNVRDGGLKRDLTSAFENSTVYDLAFPTDQSKELLNESGLVDLSVSGATGGPNWDNLRAYYNLKDQVNADGSVDMIKPSPAAPEAVDGPPYRLTNAHKTAPHTRNSPIYPVISRIQIGFALESYQTTLESGETVYKLRLHIKPVIGLYNPYNVKINAADYYVSWFLRPFIRITIFSNSEVQFYLSEVLPIINEVNQDLKMSAKNLDFEPGETRLLTLYEPHDLYESDSWAELSSNDWAADGSFWLDFEDVHVATHDGKGGAKNPKVPGWEYVGFTTNEQEQLTATDANSSVKITILSNDMGTFSLLVDNPASKLNYLQTIERPWKGTAGQSPGNASKSFIIGQLQGALDIVNWVYWLRTSNATQPLRALVDTNIRPMAITKLFDGFYNDYGYPLPSFMEAPQTGDSSTLAVQSSSDVAITGDRNQGFWGAGVSASKGENHVTLFDVPREPLTSLGALQHAHLTYFVSDTTYPLGNSFANPRIARDQPLHIYPDMVYWLGGPTHDVPVADLSYFINRVIWDGYFFSSIKESVTDTEIEQAMAGTGEELMANPRIKFYQPTEDTLTATQFTAPSSLEDYEALGSTLMVDGAFNVNSTSVNAWKALLNSMSGLEVPRYTPSSPGNAQFATESNALFSRLSHPFAGGFDSNEDSTNDAFWTGYRRLDSTQVDALAREIVHQVKLRGPFLSMADFVNRKLSNDDLGLNGTLQAALDHPDVKINSKLNTDLDGGELAADTLGEGFYPNFHGTQASGFTGYLMQSDILQALAPVLSVRSDTFVIRSYGSSLDPLTQRPVAKAWCEAIVQRVPTPASMDSGLSDERNLFTGGNLFPETTPTNGMSLGSRSYKVVAFRWLNESEL